MVSSVYAGGYTLRDTGEQTSDTRQVLIRGVGASPFDADNWAKHPPNLLPDIRQPIIAPRPGIYQNIYAPSIVQNPGGGWYIYYGAWDGIPEGRDHIYATTTPDFLSFGQRHTIIAPSSFHHVCNVNAQPDISGNGMALMCTVYPDKKDRNKPALFQLSQPIPGKPINANFADIVKISGYPHYNNADINGMNVLLRDEDRTLLYFSDFKNFGHVFVAENKTTSSRGFQLQGTALDQSLAVNDVKKLHDNKMQDWYLMGLHMNRGELYYSLSRDPLSFSTSTLLLRSVSDKDKFIVSMGWVTKQDHTQGRDTVLGVLYGAGSKSSLDANRIFASWIQKKLEFKSSDSTPLPIILGAVGPDTLVLKINAQAWHGNLTLSRENGKLMQQIPSITLTAGHIYQLKQNSSSPANWIQRH